MINEESIKQVENSCFSTKFRKPLYDSYCFSKIPATVSYLLTGNAKEKALPSSCFLKSEYDTVILLFLDAFGWCMWNRFRDHPFIRRCETEGIVSKITSQFPSTTAAHVTTIHSGLSVAQSGIYEWYQYEPKVGKVIAPLLFSYAGDSVTNSLLSTKIAPEEFFPFPTLYEALRTQDVTSFVFQEAGISQSIYSQAMGKGAHLMGYLSLSQGLQSLCELCTSQGNKNYAFFYHSHIDCVGHRKGVDSPSFEKSILYCLDRLERELIPLLQKQKEKKIALLVTADHGMVSVDPKKTLYLNESIKGIEKVLSVPDPSGSCRDLFLKIQEEERKKSLLQIQKAIEDKGEVWKIEDLIQEGVFGPLPMSPRFLERVGNTVILPYEGEAIWWFEKHRFSQNFYASHGGLTPHEMETLFAFLPF